GYSAFDVNWKPAESILYNLLRINKLGGNYLLNIGPRADGSIPEGSVQVLEEIGAWVADNAPALHGTRPSPFAYNLPYGPTTWNEVNGGKHLYYHVFYWDESGELWIPGVMNPAEEVSVSIPSAPQVHFTVESVHGIGLRVSGLPREAPTALCTTLDIQFNSEPDLEEGIREINGSIYLDALGGKVIGGEFVEWDTKPCYNWYSGRNISYKMVVTRGGNYRVSVNLAGYYSGTITFNFSDGSKLQGRNTATPSGYRTFEWQDMGTVYLEPGEYTFDVSSQQSDSWLKLRGIRFVHQ
ncbi:MAG: alpha-L-fucosidase, partial [Lachnospiraceae bacterium]|nr:alpha-L-fucosidase [Lachnospiraceae bacterium]